MTISRPALTPRFHEALAYASTIHAARLCKGTQIPYVSHLLAVASIVLDAGGTEDEAIAALFNDVGLEPHAIERIADLRTRFGDAAARVIEACGEASEEPAANWVEGRIAYAKRLAAADPSALLVSAADRVHAARTALRDFARDGDRVWKRFDETRDQVVWNFENLIKAYDRGASDPRRFPLVSDLRAAVLEIRAIIGKQQRLAKSESQN